ncbi:metallophosphoesterase family protein, partial [Streptomyces rimosus]
MRSSGPWCGWQTEAGGKRGVRRRRRGRRPAGPGGGDVRGRCGPRERRSGSGAGRGGLLRFLHTSDWHLGRSFHRVNLLGAQRAFLDHLVETVRTENVDAVLVAGDVYDRAVPPLAAVELFDDALH